MKLNTLLAGAAAAVLSCTSVDKSQAPAETEQDQQSQKLDEAIRTIKRTKAELLRALGVKLDGYRVFDDEHGRPTAVACAVNSSEFDAYSVAAAAARGIVQEHSKKVVTGFTNDSREEEVDGGTVACVKSTATTFKGE